MSAREPVWRRYLRFVRPDVVRDVDDELAFHLAMREEEYVRMGMSPDEARREASERFGAVPPVRHATLTVARRMLRARLRSRHLLELGQDLRFGLRTLRQRPGFTAAVVLTLAIGIGATTAIFSVIHAVLFQPPAQVRNPHELIAVYTSDYSGPWNGGSSYPDYDDFRQASDVLSGLASYEGIQPNVVLRGAAQLRPAELVSANYFDVLGVRVQAGRFFRPEEDGEPGAHPVAVMSDALWRVAANADTGIVGETIKANGRIFTVVGIAAPGFVGVERGSRTDLWIPRTMASVLESGVPRVARRDDRGIHIMGRLREGVSREAAQARFDGIAAQLFAAWPELWRDVSGGGRRITVLPEKDSRVSGDQRGRVIAFFGLLMGAVTVLLLLCSANVATLLVLRGSARSREIAVRLSIGASRGRLIRQLMTENLILAVAGGTAGLWVAQQIARLLLAMLGARPGDLDVSLGAPVLAFGVAVTLGSLVCFGVAPALRASRADLQRALKGDGSGARLGRRRFAFRDLLVATQVALSLVLLAVAGLLVRSLQMTLRADTGFETSNMVLAMPDLSVGYDSTRARAYYRAIEERAAALPGVERVWLARVVPLGGGISRSSISIEGYEPRPGEDMEFGNNTVESGYFASMGIPVVQGREFSAPDREGAPDVAMVNETFAQRYWPGQGPLGRRFSLGGATGRAFTVVGVARDIDYGRVGEEARPYFYLPFAQRPSVHMIVHVRTTGPEGPTLDAMKGILKDVDPEVPVVLLGTMRERVARLLETQRASATLLTLLGAVGLLLAGTGLYAVIAFSVAQRTREFGIRIALGASSARVRRMVVRQAVVLAGTGAVVGIAASIAVARALASQLFGISPGDPATYAVAVFVLLVVAAAASWAPARRATALNPAEVMRND